MNTRNVERIIIEFDKQTRGLNMKLRKTKKEFDK